MSKYETSAGYVIRGTTYAKLLDLLDQLIDTCRTATNPAIGATTTYTRMLALCDDLIDQSAVIAHLHKTETNPKDRALGDGWLAISHAFQTIRSFITALTKAIHEPQAWRDMTDQLEAMKYKLTPLAKRAMQ